MTCPDEYQCPPSQPQPCREEEDLDSMSAYIHSTRQQPGLFSKVGQSKQVNYSPCTCNVNSPHFRCKVLYTENACIPRGIVHHFVHKLFFRTKDREIKTHHCKEEKITLPGAPADVSEFACVNTLCVCVCLWQ